MHQFVVCAVTKVQRERKKRLEEFSAYKDPGVQYITLPTLPKGTTVAAFTFSLNDGMRWRVSFLIRLFSCIYDMCLHPATSFHPALRMYMYM